MYVCPALLRYILRCIGVIIFDFDLHLIYFSVSFFVVNFLCFSSLVAICTDWVAQSGNQISVAVVCRLISCILHNHELTTVYLDHEPSACVGHAAWQIEGLPVLPDEVVAKGWTAVLQVLRFGVKVPALIDECQDFLTHSHSKFKLGSRECDVDSEEVYASGAGVSDADCALLAVLMRAGKLNNVKRLRLVRL